MIFIGLVALALVAIAAAIAVVAWYLVKLLDEVTIVTQRLHHAGEIVAEDMARIKDQLQGGQIIYSIDKTT